MIFDACVILLNRSLMALLALTECEPGAATAMANEKMAAMRADELRKLKQALVSEPEYKHFRGTLTPCEVYSDCETFEA
jgi:hypothetical protein